MSTTVACTPGQDDRALERDLTRALNAVETLAYVVRGPLDLDILQLALDETLGRHDGLRMYFPTDRVLGTAQLAAPDVHWPLAREDIRAEQERHSALVRVVAATRNRVADPGEPPLVAATVVRVAGEEWRLIIGVHGLVWDGHSDTIFARELTQQYAALADTGVVSRDRLPESFVRHAEAEQSFLQTPAGADRVHYWLEQFETLGVSPALALPASIDAAGWHSGPVVASEVAVPADAVAQTREQWRRLRVTPFMGLTAAVLLAIRSRQRGKTRVGAKIPESGRFEAGTLDVIGAFASSFPIWVDLESPDDYAAATRKVRDAVRSLLSHSISDRHVLKEFLARSSATARAAIERERSRPFAAITLMPDTTTTPRFGRAEVTVDRAFHLRREVMPPVLLVSLELDGDPWRIVVEHPQETFDPTWVNGILDDVERRLLTQPSA
jgi:hypothetical protein